MFDSFRSTKRGRSLIAAALLTAPLLLAQQPVAARDDEPRHEQHEREFIHELPHGHGVVHIGHDEYFVHEGHFYQRHPEGFVVVRPPIGAVVATLPVGFVSVAIGGAPYFVANGVYYRHGPHGYVIVETPPGAIVAAAPLPPSVVVQASALNVRSGPSAGAPVIAVVPSGQQLLVQGAQPGWYFVQLPNGQHGWVMSAYTIPVPPPAAG
jgi:uncharacterized protein YgiM (DUF1202 family)